MLLLAEALKEKKNRSRSPVLSWGETSLFLRQGHKSAEAKGLLGAWPHLSAVCCHSNHMAPSRS